jgi:hypothetical protein
MCYVSDALFVWFDGIAILKNRETSLGHIANFQRLEARLKPGDNFWGVNCI